jgi:hypothetical protein
MKSEILSCSPQSHLVSPQFGKNSGSAVKKKKQPIISKTFKKVPPVHQSIDVKVTSTPKKGNSL